MIPVVGSPPHLERILEKIGWSKQKGGVNVNVNMAEHALDATLSDLEGIEGEVLEHRS